MDLIRKYFPELSPAQFQKFDALYPLYLDWNNRINVISRKDIGELYLKHVVHSLSIARFIQFKPGAKILDLGTGGGFPGIPLAILFPQSHFTLIDSIRKKITVVREIASATGLKNIEAFQKNAADYHEKFDFVVSRAVTAMPKLIELSKSNISPMNRHQIPNGIICLKGGDLKQELAPYKETIQLIPVSSYFDEEFFETKSIVYLPLQG